jgi:hypothetical protein
MRVRMRNILPHLEEVARCRVQLLGAGHGDGEDLAVDGDLSRQHFLFRLLAIADGFQVRL